MKVLLLSLFFLTSCSVARYYQGPALTQELRKNATSLELVMATIETDFEQKETFLEQFQVKGKDPFIKENLDQKLDEMKGKREAVIRRMSYIRNMNNGLLSKVENKSKIKEGDPVFREIENFADDKDRELSVLMKEFANYQKASEEFEKLAFFTRMVKL
jgi:hypothetical protein